MSNKCPYLEAVTCNEQVECDSCEWKLEMDKYGFTILPMGVMGILNALEDEANKE